MADRVVITGLGCLTAAGLNAETTWGAVKSGESGIDRMADGQICQWPYPLVGEIKGYNPRKLLADRKLLKAISREDVIGLNAVAQALDHSKLLEHRDALDDPERFNDRTGVFAGSPGGKYRHQYDYLPVLAAVHGDHARFGDRAMEQVHPMWLLRTLPNNVLGYVGMQYRLKGPNHNFTDHSVSGTQAIAEAARYMQEGAIDRAIVVAYESAVEPEGIAYYASLGLLSSRGLHPFDADRDGTVLAEGAGALVLETLAAARERGARIYGEVLGSAIVSEARGILSIRDDGEGLARAIRLALQGAGLGPGEVGMVTAHANGTRNSDASEARALGEVFGGCAVPVTGFKWCLGHTIAASGVIETILTLFCLGEGRVPGIPTLRTRAHDCEDLNVCSSDLEPRSSIGLVVTRGFAGLTSCVVICADAQ